MFGMLIYQSDAALFGFSFEKTFSMTKTAVPANSIIDRRNSSKNGNQHNKH